MGENLFRCRSGPTVPKFLGAFGVTLFVSACGGGGSGASAPTAPAPPAVTATDAARLLDQATFGVMASDMISVIIRATLTQLATPDEMRGRVTAVDMIFIGTSNEFGQFESGVTAQWFGTVPAVVLGGIGTLVVIGLWAWLFPELRQAAALTEIKAPEMENTLGTGGDTSSLPS